MLKNIRSGRETIHSKQSFSIIHLRISDSPLPASPVNTAENNTIIATDDGVAGIKIKSDYKNVFICNNNKDFAKQILLKLNSKKINKRVSKYYSKLYKMKNIVENFFLKHNLLN
mgnify:CR=1 FL=1